MKENASDTNLGIFNVGFGQIVLSWHSWDSSQQGLNKNCDNGKEKKKPQSRYVVTNHYSKIGRLRMGAVV